MIVGVRNEVIMKEEEMIGEILMIIEDIIQRKIIKGKVMKIGVIKEMLGEKEFDLLMGKKRGNK